MKEEVKYKILTRSEWFILPYLLVFCLLTLGNVADNWALPGILVFVAQSIVIAIELFTAFHIALIIGMEEFTPSINTASSTNVSMDDVMGGVVAIAVFAIAAIPLSFFWGWVLFALAFALLLYHIGISIYLFLNRQAVTMAAEEKPAEQDKMVIEMEKAGE